MREREITKKNATARPKTWELGEWGIKSKTRIAHRRVVNIASFLLGKEDSSKKGGERGIANRWAAD